MPGSLKDFYEEFEKANQQTTPEHAVRRATQEADKIAARVPGVLSPREAELALTLWKYAGPLSVGPLEAAQYANNATAANDYKSIWPGGKDPHREASLAAARAEDRRLERVRALIALARAGDADAKKELARLGLQTPEVPLERKVNPR